MIFGILALSKTILGTKTLSIVGSIVTLSRKIKNTFYYNAKWHFLTIKLSVVVQSVTLLRVVLRCVSVVRVVTKSVCIPNVVALCAYHRLFLIKRRREQGKFQEGVRLINWHSYKNIYSNFLLFLLIRFFRPLPLQPWWQGETFCCKFFRYKLWSFLLLIWNKKRQHAISSTIILSCN